MMFNKRVLALISMFILSLTSGVLPAAAMQCTFLNPVITRGEDPSVVYKDGYYYLVLSTGGMLTITKSATLTGLSSAAPTPVFTPPSGEEYSFDLWAPELAYLRGKWYIYVAATNAPGNNPSHRMYVLEADADDPLGSWTMRGKVYDPAADQWAIDGVVFEYNDKLYMVWSGWETEKGDFPQNLYIAEMSDPLTLSSPRHMISEPDQPWEQSVAAIQEGPQVFMHNGQLSIVYSADASWTPAYKLALLKLTGDDLLDRNSWTKMGPLFEKMTDAALPIYGPGHNSNPVPSPDGQEDWLVFHAKTLEENGWGDRAIFMQKFTWAEDNTPVFGIPIPRETAQTVPSGEACGLVAEFVEVEIPPAAEGENSFFDTGAPLLNTAASFSVAAEVQLQNLDGNYAFVSQGGGLASSFVLGYYDGKFTFTMSDSLGQHPASISAVTPEPNTWYHLVATYNSATQETSLYVDGQPQVKFRFTEPWNALGNTVIGAARLKAKWVDFAQDIQIRNVRLYNGSLEDSEIQALAGE